MHLSQKSAKSKSVTRPIASEVSSSTRNRQEAKLAENRAAQLRRENQIKEAQRREKVLDQKEKLS